MRIGSIVIMCYEFDRMLAFWSEALQYVPREPATDGWVVLRDPAGRAPHVSLNRVSKKRSGRSRLYLDLYTSDPGTRSRAARHAGRAGTPLLRSRLSDASAAYAATLDPRNVAGEAGGLSAEALPTLFDIRGV